MSAQETPTTAACCDEAEDYELLRDAIAEAFNPSDDDVAEVAILIRAVENARHFIACHPCFCTAADVGDQRPCARCQVLGRLADKAMDRG